jgi:Ulp1 family protease
MTKAKSKRQQEIQTKNEPSNVYTNVLQRWINDEHKQSNFIDPILEPWSHKIYNHDEVPQQIQLNCGVHVLASIENLVRSNYDIERARSFNKEDIPSFRKKIALNILNKEIPR